MICLSRFRGLLLILVTSVICSRALRSVSAVPTESLARQDDESTSEDREESTEDSSDFWPQAISMIASITAGLSTIIVTQLTKRFPISFHSPTPRWKYMFWPMLGYLIVYVGLLLYGILRTNGSPLSATLAFMAAPGIPLHGFTWALIPQTRHALGPPATETYIPQCFSRKPAILLILSWLPLIGAAIAAGIMRDWQGMALQLAAGVSFLATGRTPETMPEARESAFGRAGRFLLLPRPGRRSETVAYSVDLEEENMLPPVRLSMDGVTAYQGVSELTFGRHGRDSDDAKTSETPVVTYIDTLIANFRPERLGDMTNSLWRTMEALKSRVHEPAKEHALMYALVERMSYVAFRPGSCTNEERTIAVTLNFINCKADAERGDGERKRIADELLAQWREAGIELVQSGAWKNAHDLSPNNVDLDVPEPSTIVGMPTSSDVVEEDVIDTIGAMICFLRLIFGHDANLVEAIRQHVPSYHNRIKLDLLQHGCIPAVCHGMLFSMKKNGKLSGNVYGHEWAADGAPLLWGGGGYAILDQAYARYSAITYVGQLAVIVVKAVLEG